jgi:hypothetical protein
MLLLPSTVLAIISIFSNKEITWLDAKVFSIFPEFSLGRERKYFQIIEANLTNTIIGVFFIIGALLVSFSKEENEDEYIAQLRLKSLMWAVLINYLFLILAFLFIFNIAFISVMLYNMFTVLIIFILKFHISLYKSSKFLNSEK